MTTIPCPNPACPFDGEGKALTALGTTITAYCAGCVELTSAWDAEATRWKWVERDLAAARVPDRLRPLSLATYPRDAAGRSALAAAERWLEAWMSGERRNLVLWGGVGGGKTGLAWGIAREVIVHSTADRELESRSWPGWSCAFETWRGLLDEMRTAISEDQRGELPALRRARAATVLVLDDLGAERPTEWAREQLASLVEARYGKKMPMVVTSNYALGELAKRLGHDDITIGKRIISRIADGADQHHIDVRDRRVP